MIDGTQPLLLFYSTEPQSLLSSFFLDPQQEDLGLRKTPGFVRYLKNNQNIEPIEGADKELLLHFLHFGEIVEKSQVSFDENKKIKVISGPMKGLEGRIVKVDKRKRRAKISLSLYEESFTIDFGFEILEKIEDNEQN